MSVSIRLLHENASVPQYATDGAAACDLCALSTAFVPPNEVRTIHTGIALAMPSSMVALILPRSGLGSRGLHLANSTGVIDSDYRGELLVKVRNVSSSPLSIDKGDRIAQLLFLPVVQATFTQVDALPASTRGDGGFGSTGK